MRRLIICTGHAQSEDANSEKAETCILIWSHIRKNQEQSPDGENLPAYRHSYKVYHYIRFTEGALGIKSSTPPESFLKRFDTDAGALVANIIQGSPAEKAALVEGDIIMDINNIPYYSGVFKDFNYGGDNELKIYRNGEIIKKSVFIPG